jgi:hypothetical protein
MGLYDLLIAIGSCRLVVGNPIPPLGDSASQSQGAPAGVFCVLALVPGGACVDCGARWVGWFE